MSQVTVLILVPKSGDRLPRCLESAAWADDIFRVVDTKTDDGSEEVAREHTDHVALCECRMWPGFAISTAIAATPRGNRQAFSVQMNRLF